MNKNRLVLVLLMGSYVLAGLFGAGCAEVPGDQAPGVSRVDIITLDTMAAAGQPERPVVQFPHERHAEALDGEAGCQTCHPLIDGRWSFDFMRSSATTPRAARDDRHQQCLSCHQAAVTSAPLTCGGCHTRNLPAPPDVTTPPFYDTYHALHEYLEDGCGLCHHEYDPEAGELYYAEGYESACWSCHPAERQGDMPSLKEASHFSCVVCHASINREAMMGLPVNCAGCHQEAGPSPAL